MNHFFKIWLIIIFTTTYFLYYSFAETEIQYKLIYDRVIIIHGENAEWVTCVNCQSKCNSYYAFTLARTTDPVLLQLLWHRPERPFHQHSYIRSAGFRTGRVSTSHCNRQLPLSVIFVYHGIVVTKKKDRIQTYHSRSCLSPHIEKISMLYRNHDTGLFGQFQAFSGLL